MTYSFEKLRVWQSSRELNAMLYQLTEKFPSSETFGLKGQIRRAIVSVSTNLAEGSGKQTSKDKARFIAIAFGSLMEVLNLVILSKDLKYITEAQIREIRMKIDDIAQMLSGLRKSFINQTR